MCGCELALCHAANVMLLCRLLKIMNGWNMNVVRHWIPEMANLGKIFLPGNGQRAGAVDSSVVFVLVLVSVLLFVLVLV